MATAVTSQKLASIMKIEAFDHDPGVNTALITSPDGGTTKRYVALENYGAFGVIAKPTVVGGNGLTLLEIVAATDSAGTDETVVLAHAATVGNSLDEYVWLEVTASQVKEQADSSGKVFTHVGARLTMATNTDEASVVYIRAFPRYPTLGLTATSSN